jgi:hypothetical protein
MSSPVNAIVTGTFSTPATTVPVYINLPCGFDKIELINLTDFGQNTTNIVKADGYSQMQPGSAFYSTATSATALAVEGMTLVGGFTFVADTGNQTPGTPYAITAITAASPAVVSSGTTPSVGSIVRLYGTTGMLQVGGWDFTVSAATAGVSFSIANLDAAAFGAAATAGYWELIPYDARFYPVHRMITWMAANALNPNYTDVVLSVTHGFTVGQLVRIYIPIQSNGTSQYGMAGMNQVLATVVAIGATVAGSTNTITLDVSCAGQSAFVFPTSAIAALGVGIPLIVPVGETARYPYQNLLDDATDNKSFSGVIISNLINSAASKYILTPSKNYMWIAYRGTAETLPILT